MDQIEFRKARESGQSVDDAGQHEEVAEHEEQEDDRFVEDDEQEQEEQAADETGDEPDEELSPKELTAFDKRMERERKKLEEKIRSEMEEQANQTKQEYSKYKEAIEAIGGDPDKVLKAAKEAQMMREAQALAKQNNWTQDETNYYVQQQKQQQELKELRTQMQINRLKDRPDYAGIASMERDILAMIDKSNGALSVEEAYWALGGPKKAEQFKLEAQQREIAKRQQAPRTVQKDSSSQSSERPLPANVIADAKRMGISEAEARRLMSKEPAQNIDEFRARKAK